MRTSFESGREQILWQGRPAETPGDQGRPAESMHIKAIRFITVSHHETVLSFDVDRDETSSTYWNASYISFRYELSASCPTRKHVLQIDILHCTCKSPGGVHREED